MLKYKNIIDGVITSIIGSIFLGASAFHYVYPFFNSEYEVKVATLIVGVLLGGGLLFMPDDLIKKLINRQK